MVRVYQAHSYPGESEESKQRKLTDEAIAEIKSIEGVLAVSPAYEVGGEAKLGNKTGYLQIIGIDAATMELMDFDVDYGRMLNTSDQYNVVAGSRVIDNFYDPRQQPDRVKEWEEGDPLELLDKRVSVTLMNQRQQKRIYSLNVVGILSAKSLEYAWSVFAPIKEVKKMRDFSLQGMQGGQAFPPGKEIAVPELPRELPSKGDDQYSFALVRAQDVSYAKYISQELRDRGFNATSMADNLDGIEHVARQMQAVLGGIGAITLLVAAIGITNTMIMSIYERTREIAIMKVVGASFADIRTLFLAESSLIGIIGGTLGIGLSYFLSYLLNKYVGAMMFSGMEGENMFQISLIPPWLILFALIFSMGIGLISGLYPANRAIKLDPIDAMRNG
ncbi:MAG: ABC transporter permease [Firmicutes bacterium]|nr:ABC transporter permease [Bacillota bacterium]